MTPSYSEQKKGHNFTKTISMPTLHATQEYSKIIALNS